MNASVIKQKFAQYKIVALLVAIALIWLFFSWKTGGGFISPRNLSNLMRQMAVTGILACGMSFVIISGEIDLSVGSLLGLLGGAAAVLDVMHHVPLPVTIVVVLVAGLLLGMFNGYLVAYAGIPSFIVGLGGMLAYRGVVLGVTNGTTVAPVSSSMVQLAQGYLPDTLGVAFGLVLFGIACLLTWRSRANLARHKLPLPKVWQDGLRLGVIGLVLFAFVRVVNDYEGIPYPVLLLLVLLGVFSYVATQTVFGRRVYAVGSNMEATRLSGIDVRAVKLWIFGIMGLDVRAGRADQHGPPGGRLAIGRHQRRAGRHRRLLHRRHVDARRLGHRARRADRRAGHGQPGQRHVDAGRRRVLADDRQGVYFDTGRLGRCRHPRIAPLGVRPCICLLTWNKLY